VTSPRQLVTVGVSPIYTQLGKHHTMLYCNKCQAE